MPPTSRTRPDDQCNRFGIPIGCPTHLRDGQARRSELTRCGLLTAGVYDRVTDQPDSVDCYACIVEGPAAAYVVLPDGRLIERRSSALADYQYAIAELRERRDGMAWRLVYWTRDLGEAEFLRDYERSGRTAQILPVQDAGCRT